MPLLEFEMKTVSGLGLGLRLGFQRMCQAGLCWTGLGWGRLGWLGLAWPSRALAGLSWTGQGSEGHLELLWKRRVR